MVYSKKYGEQKYQRVSRDCGSQETPEERPTTLLGHQQPREAIPNGRSARRGFGQPFGGIPRPQGTTLQNGFRGQRKRTILRV